MTDKEKLELQEATAEDDESSFAKWLPPALSVETAATPPEATLTGLGPLGSEGRDEKSGTVVLGSADDALFIQPSDADDDDEPTQILTNLFPDLVPKLRSSPVGSGPLTHTLLLGAPLPANTFQEPIGESRTEPEDDAETAQLPEVATLPPPEAAEADTDDTLEILDGPEDEASLDLAAAGFSGGSLSIEHAATQQAELLAAMVEGLGPRRSAPPLPRYSVDPVLRESQNPPAPGVDLSEDGLPLLAPPEVPVNGQPSGPMFPPTVLIASERERPTAPASRKPPVAALTLEAEAPPRATPLSEPPWAQTVLPKTSSRAALRYAVGAFALSALATVLILRAILPGKGSVVVTAVGANGSPISNAQVLIDGEPACSPAPCRVAKLREGRHVVSVSAPGYKSAADRGVDVPSGSEASVEVALTPLGTTTGNASLHVRVQARGLRVFLDGEDRGEAPISIGGLTPSEHTIRLSGSPLYAPFEQKLTLEPNANVTLSPSLVPRQASIVITPGPAADGAAIEVLGGKDKKSVGELPARVEVPLLGSYTVRATRSGYQTLEIPVRFAEGEFEKQVRVGLSPASDKDAHAVKRPDVTLPVVLEDAPAAPPPPAPVGQGSLSVSSVPPVNVIVDGRPLGATPRKLNVPPGSHAVVFIHPTLGRKTVNVKVESGKTAVANVQY